MAQLTDDCFAFAGPLLPLDEMERLIAERVASVAECEEVPLRAALGRVLAADVIAAVDVPPFDNSAVDGFAVRSQDLDPQAETKLLVVDRVAAGHAPLRPLGAGEATRIFTGAPMPAGADTVFMQEDIRREGDFVLLPPGLKRGANRRLAGEDVCAGAVILPAGRRLAAAHLALAAAVGLTRLPVRRRVRVAMFSTGDEIVEPGSQRPHPALFDSNRYLLDGLLVRLGAEITDLGILSDRAGAIGDRVDGGGSVARPGAHLRRGLDRRGRSRARGFGEDRQAGVLAGRHQARSSGCDGRLSRGDRPTRHSSACRAIRPRCLSPLRGWCGHCCCG